MEICLEEITKNNVKDILSVYNYYVLNSTATFGTEELTEGEFLKYYKIGEEKTISKAVSVDGKTIGFSLLKPWNSSKKAYENTYEYTIYLHPDYCGKGIGKKVYNLTEKYVLERNINVVIAVICAENALSYKTFEYLGFEKCGTIKKIGKKFGRYLDMLYYEKIYE